MDQRENWGVKVSFSPKIVNVVATATLDRSVNLEFLARNFNNVYYAPEQYPVAYIKSKGMKGKVSIFSTGKMISVGTRSWRAAKQDLIFVARKFKAAGIAKLKTIPRIQNIVATAEVRKNFDLARLVEQLDNAIYEPETFPAVIYKYEDITCLIFSQGKIVFVGAKNFKQLKKFSIQLKATLRSLKTDF